MRTPRSLPLLLSVAIAGSSVASAEDLTITFQTMAGKQAGTSTHFLTADRIKTADAQSDTIVELAAGRIITIDHKRKQYSEITLEEIEAILAGMSAQMEAASAQMAEAMKNMPASMREKMGGMLGASGEASIVKGATRQIAGYDAQQYTVTLGEGMRMEMWTTTALKLPMDPGPFRKMARFANPMLSNPMLKNVGQLVEKLQEVDGYSLAEATQVSMMGKNMETSREATSVTAGAIPASTFEIPAGYKKGDSPFEKMKAKK